MGVLKGPEDVADCAGVGAEGAWGVVRLSWEGRLRLGELFLIRIKDQSWKIARIMESSWTASITEIM